MKRYIFLLLIFAASAAVYASGPRKPWKRHFRPRHHSFYHPGFPGPELRHHSRRHHSRGCRVLPFGAMGISPFHPDLFFSGGIFYRFESGFYFPSALPSGLVIRSIPAGFRRIRYRGRPFYFGGGNLFRECPSGYEKVDVPAGLRVPELPGEQLEEYAAGEGVYRFEDNLWQLVETEEGEEWECLGPCRG